MEPAFITDLKQFITELITTTVAQQAQELQIQIDSIRQDISQLDKKFTQKVGDLDKKLTEQIARLDCKIDDISGSMAEALDLGYHAHEKKYKNHEARLIKLETYQQAS